MERDQYIREQVEQGTSEEEAKLAWKNLQHAKKLVNGELPITPEVSFSKLRGFATLTKEERRRVASEGGKKAHAKGKAHKFTTEEAKAAGSKGGKRVAQDVEHMREIGRRGGSTVAGDVEHMREIGRKGGKRVSENREHMKTIGKTGGDTKAGKYAIYAKPSGEAET